MLSSHLTHLFRNGAGLATLDACAGLASKESMACASDAFQGHTRHAGAHLTVRRAALADILLRTPLNA